MSESTTDNTAERTVPPDYGFSVFRNAHDEITIKQPNPFEDDEIISVTVERVDQLIQFLQEVRDEIVADRRTAGNDIRQPR